MIAMRVRRSYRTLDLVLELQYHCAPLTCSRRSCSTCRCWLFQGHLFGQLWALSSLFSETVVDEVLKPAVLVLVFLLLHDFCSPSPSSSLRSGLL